jgi:hypothetical protein
MTQSNPMHWFPHDKSRMECSVSLFLHDRALGMIVFEWRNDQEIVWMRLEGSTEQRKFTVKKYRRKATYYISLSPRWLYKSDGRGLWMTLHENGWRQVTD